VIIAQGNVCCELSCCVEFRVCFLTVEVCRVACGGSFRHLDLLNK
jgi:hypothetical protein